MTALHPSRQWRHTPRRAPLLPFPCASYLRRQRGARERRKARAKHLPRALQPKETRKALLAFHRRRRFARTGTAAGASRITRLRSDLPGFIEAAGGWPVIADKWQALAGVVAGLEARAAAKVYDGRRLHLLPPAPPAQRVAVDPAAPGADRTGGVRATWGPDGRVTFTPLPPSAAGQPDEAPEPPEGPAGAAAPQVTERFEKSPHGDVGKWPAEMPSFHLHAEAAALKGGKAFSEWQVAHKKYLKAVARLAEIAGSMKKAHFIAQIQDDKNMREIKTEELARWAYTFVMAERWKRTATPQTFDDISESSRQFWRDEAAKFLAGKKGKKHVD